MAALLLGCCGIFSSHLSKKHRDRKEREMEYSQNFETLKEENAKRVRQLSDAGVQGYENYAGNDTVISTSGSRGPSIESGHCPSQQHMDTVHEDEGGNWTPPSYDDAVGPPGSVHERQRGR